MVELNTEHLKFRTQTGNSLTDLNDLPLFTRDFQQTGEKLQQEADRREEILTRQVFRLDIADGVMDSEVTDNLFQNSAQSIQNAAAETVDNAAVNNAAGRYSIWAALCLGMLLACLILWRGRHHGKGQSRSDDDNQHPAGGRRAADGYPGEPGTENQGYAADIA